VKKKKHNLHKQTLCRRIKIIDIKTHKHKNKIKQRNVIATVSNGVDDMFQKDAKLWCG
jgi:hypothetical protein